MSTLEAIQSKISKYVNDLKPAAKGEMSLYSHTKELRIQVSIAQTVQKASLTKFVQQAEELKPSVAMFVSCVDDIPFNVQSTPCLTFFVNSKDLSKRFLEYLKSLPDINEPEEDENEYSESDNENDENEYSDSEEKPKKKSKKSVKSIKSTKTTKTSFIEAYDSTPEGFDKYCHEVVKSKIEFKKAQEKWSKQMKSYPKVADFIEYVNSLKTNKTDKPEPKGTVEEFHKFIKDTPISKITKSYIKDNFGNLDDSITFLNETKDFKKKISELKKSL